MKNNLAGVRPTVMEINRAYGISPWMLYEEETSLEETLAIIDDATCHGFEFKVENGKLYYRETLYIPSSKKRKKREPLPYYLLWTLVVTIDIISFIVVSLAIVSWLTQ